MTTTTTAERRIIDVHAPVVVNETPVHVAKEAIKSGLWAAHDPFLLMMDDQFGQGAFGLHPHRGIETITYIIDGRLEHNDNRGGGGMLGARDVQLMTAAKGIIHNEVPPAGETVHSLQLWLNMPAAVKLSEPRYQDLHHAEMPQVHTTGATVTVYSGSSHGVRVDTLNHVPFTLVEIDLEAGASAVQDLPGSYNGFVHIIHGQGQVGADRTSASEGQTLWLDRTDTAGDTTITITADTSMRVLVAAGEPLHEPVVAAGPFVMNTDQQIADAYADYKAGRFNP
jgi:quercetin 2,3-dioxygenase